MLTYHSSSATPEARRNASGSRPRILLMLTALLTACSPATTPKTTPNMSESAATAPAATASELVESGSASISEIQGAGHRSPWLGRRVETRGVVTAINETAIGEGAVSELSVFIQDRSGDGDAATSDALLGRFPATAALEPGQVLELVGWVEELRRREKDLTITSLRVESFKVLGVAPELPAARILDAAAIPDQIIDDDALHDYQPASDAIDFLESIEGMRVAIRDAHVVGPTNRRGEVFVVAAGGLETNVQSSRGGLLRREQDANPEVLMVDAGFGIRPPEVDVGQSLGEIDAIVDYGRGSYRLRLLQAPTVSGLEPPREKTRLVGDDRHLTIGSFNVLNLAANDPPEKARSLAQIIVHHLGAPDILGVQEIQDDNGALDDGTVSATATYQMLIEAIQAAGGPLYEVRQLDPQNNADGGRPGGNIRVGLLFQPDRLQAIDAQSDSSQPVFARHEGRIELRPSPARLLGPAFDRNDSGQSGTRKPLVAQFRFHDRDLFVINLHLRSKGGDDSGFGARQPPQRPSESQRTAQAQAVRRLIDSWLEADPNAWILVLGDLNEHRGRPPLEALEGALVNLLERLGEEERYSYVYRGQAQILDHMLASPGIATQASPEIDIVHVAADYAATRQASDHDPIVVRLRFQ